MNELDAALALGEIARARKAAGLPGLNEVEAAIFLRELAELRSLPEASAERAPVPVRVPVPRKPPRMAPRSWLNRQ
jgi:hypothetical protein